MKAIVSITCGNGSNVMTALSKYDFREVTKKFDKAGTNYSITFEDKKGNMIVDISKSLSTEKSHQFIDWLFTDIDYEFENRVWLEREINFKKTAEELLITTPTFI